MSLLVFNISKVLQQKWLNVPKIKEKIRMGNGQQTICPKQKTEISNKLKSPFPFRMKFSEHVGHLKLPAVALEVSVSGIAFGKFAQSDVVAHAYFQMAD